MNIKRKLAEWRYRARQAVGSVLADLFILAGAAAFVYGVWQVYVPAAWMIGGVVVVGFTLLVAGGKR